MMPSLWFLCIFVLSKGDADFVLLKLLGCVLTYFHGIPYTVDFRYLDFAYLE